MSAFIGFPLFLVITLIFLGVVVVTGRQARRKLHLWNVAGAVASLGITIYYAEQLGDSFDLSTAGIITPIHLAMAKTTTAAYLLPLILGPMTAKNRDWLPWHRRGAYLVLLLTVLTAITGTWMVLVSDRLPV